MGEGEGGGDVKAIFSVIKLSRNENETDHSTSDFVIDGVSLVRGNCVPSGVTFTERGFHNERESLYKNNHYYLISIFIASSGASG